MYSFILSWQIAPLSYKTTQVPGTKWNVAKLGAHQTGNFIQIYEDKCYLNVKNANGLESLSQGRIRQSLVPPR